jgi:GntR family transcriptional repressor for pyruvate dehydrogenase complex
MEALLKVKLSDMVSEALVKFITEEGLKAGDKLPTEKAISERLGIGRTSVREGIRQLEAVGLLSSHQGTGIYLREVNIDSFLKVPKSIPLNDFLVLSNDEILDLLEVRLIIESAACRNAAERISEMELDQLRKLCREMEGSADRPDNFMRCDLEFHKLIIKASGNSILPKFFMLIRDLYSKQFTLSAYPHALKKAVVYHKEILAAIEHRNAELAVKHMVDHLKEVQALFQRNFSKQKKSSVGKEKHEA